MFIDDEGRMINLETHDRYAACDHKAAVDAWRRCRGAAVPRSPGRHTAVEDLARETSSAFIEVALLSDPVHAARRFEPLNPDGAVRRGIEEFNEMYKRLLAVIAGRPNTKVVETVDGEVERTYERLLEQTGA